MEEATPHRDHVALSSELAFPMNYGFHVLPGDVRGDVRFITERVVGSAEDI